MSEAVTSPVSDEMDQSTDNSLTIVRTVFLLFLLVLSLVGNSLVVFAIAVSSKRAQNPFNAYLLSMSAFGLLECSLTMSLATGFSLEGAWLFGDFLKGFNACFIQLQNIGVLLTVTAMTVDRYLAVSRQMKYRKESSVHRANYAVLYTWIHAFVISLPLLFHNENLGLTVREFVERSLCGLSEETEKIYSIILIGTSYVAPFLLAIVFFIIVFTKSVKERKEMRTENTANYASYCLQESQLLLQARCARYVLVLFFLYLVFKVPYVCIDLLTQFGVAGAFIPLNGTNITSAATDDPSGEKFYYQTAISWMMFCYSAIFPMITFAWFADHRKRIRMHLCCGKERVPLTKTNARNRGRRRHPRTIPERPTRPHGKNRVYGRAMSAKNNKRQKAANGNIKVRCKPPSSVSSIGTSKDNGAKLPGDAGPSKAFRVPVLYAAADGLHLLASNKTNNKEAALIKAPNKSNSTTSSNHASSSTDGDVSGLSASKETENTGSPTSTGRKSTKNWLTLNPGELLKRFKKNGQPNPVITTDDTGEINSSENVLERPSSVIDKRVDVLGSTDCLQSEEESYFHCASSDFEDDTESELNESANSRTLILPNRRGVTNPAKKVRRGRVISPLPPLKGAKTGFVEEQNPNETLKSKVGNFEKSQSLEELFGRGRTQPLPNAATPPLGEVEHPSQKFSSNPALQCIVDDIDETDTISLSNSILSDHHSSKNKVNGDVSGDRIFIPRKRSKNPKLGSENGEIFMKNDEDVLFHADSRLHTPSEEDRNNSRKLFSQNGSLHSYMPSPTLSRPSSSSALPPITATVRTNLTSQKFR